MDEQIEAEVRCFCLSADHDLTSLAQEAAELRKKGKA